MVTACNHSKPEIGQNIIEKRSSYLTLSMASLLYTGKPVMVVQENTSLSVFILRIIRKMKVYLVGNMQNFLMLNQSVTYGSHFGLQ